MSEKKRKIKVTKKQIYRKQKQKKKKKKMFTPQL